MPRIRMFFIESGGSALKMWLRFGEALHGIVLRVLLALVFVLAFAPIGLVRRVFGADPLARARDRRAASYWQPHESDSSMDEPF